MSNQNGNSPRGHNTNKMLIDATHPEETRVVVLRSGRVEEFDYESAARKLLRGNIYLAKITRVEPSLQAAFVDYGGNRHGFLAFNEIHPDYYQIPVADRRALIEAEAQAEAEEEAAADRAAEAAAARRNRRRGSGPQPASFEDSEDEAVDVSSMLPPEPEEVGGGDRELVRDDEARTIAERTDSEPRISEPVERRDEQYAVPASEAPRQTYDHEHNHGHDHGAHDHDHPATRTSESEPSSHDEGGAAESVEPSSSAEAEQIETVAVSEDVMEEVPSRPRRRLRSYKIQEVTKRRQVMLIQVVKEERGTKGAALTTYLSLAGRYTVLMPNTARGGGISRKITNPQDRKRLKAIAAELDVPEGMGLIIRTAGAARTKQEIKRDYEYLLRLWESVRELALNSNAPQLVYEEGNLIKRSIRDLYGKEVDEIVVAGEEAYKDAHDFMGMLLPSHVKNVIHYQGTEPLFGRYKLERQLDAMFSPYVHLRSGGYLVINQTEALVAIDINSGKSTREFSIEETALSTNLEAADEIARQVKLRDLAGLVVIDFIDMEEKRNNRSVERRLKDALRHDRARIQLGRISHFGLLEMSRQRMRTGVVEGSTTQCPHCQGSGTIRSTESIALAVLRGLEDALNAGPPANLAATTTATVALYILNNKRAFIVDMEERLGITVQIQASDKVQGANFTIDRSARREEPARRADRNVVNMDWGFDESEADNDAAGEEDVEPVAQDDDRQRGGERQGRSEEDGGGQNGDGRRRRRRRRRGRRGDQPSGETDQRLAEGSEDEGGPSFVGEDDDVRDESRDRNPRQQRGDRNRRPQRDNVDVVDGEENAAHAAEGDDARGDGPEGETEGGGEQGERTGGRRRRRRGRRGGRRGHDRDQPMASEASAADAEGVRDEAGGANGLDYDNARPSMEDRPSQSIPDAPPVSAPTEVYVPAMSMQPAVAEPFSSPAPIEAPPLSIQPAPVVVAEPAPPRRGPPVSSEPVLERVVVGPDQAVQTTEEPAKPARRGWWQRR